MISRINYYLMIILCLEIMERTKGYIRVAWRPGEPTRAPKSRRRPKPSRLRASFGVQDQRGVKPTPRTHPDSVFDVLPMVEKIIS